MSGKRQSSQSISSNEREAIFANRTNSDYKWQRAKMVVGALEVKSDPVFKPRDDLTPRYKGGEEGAFEEALQAWDDMKLRQSFVRACEDLPAEVCCCGLLRDEDASVKQYVTLLNEGWIKSANKQLGPRGIKIDAFLWNWQNASGKAETNIILIRFFMLSTYKFRRASNQGSLDLDEIISSDDDDFLGDESHSSIPNHHDSVKEASEENKETAR
jgi:hypothetical protein